MDQEIDYDKVDFLKSCAPSKTKRFFGNLIDIFVILGIIVGIIIPIQYFFSNYTSIENFVSYNDSNWFEDQFISLVVYQLYYTPLEYFKQGSIGKMIFRMRVVHEYDGKNPKITAILKRTLIRVLGIEGLVYLFGGNLWHDRWSDTLVIDIDKYEAASEIELLGEKNSGEF